jgi:hypothetical protein
MKSILEYSLAGFYMHLSGIENTTLGPSVGLSRTGIEKGKAIQVIELLKKSFSYIPSSCLFNCLTQNVVLLYKNGQSGCATVVQISQKPPMHYCRSRSSNRDLCESGLLGMAFCRLIQACIAQLWISKNAPVEFVKHGSEISC